MGRVYVVRHNCSGNLEIFLMSQMGCLLTSMVRARSDVEPRKCSDQPHNSKLPHLKCQTPAPDETRKRHQTQKQEAGPKVHPSFTFRNLKLPPKQTGVYFLKDLCFTIFVCVLVCVSKCYMCAVVQKRVSDPPTMNCHVGTGN